MDIQRVRLYASLAEIVSAAAIVISLIYAGTEFNKAQTMSNRDADNIIFDRAQELNRLVIENPGLANVMVAAADDYARLSQAERLQFLAYQHNFFDSWEIAWQYNESGIMDDETWSEWDNWFARIARQGPAAAWTDNRENFTGKPFRDHVDALLGIR